MSKIDFGELDYSGEAPAAELKEKLKVIACDCINDLKSDWAYTEEAALHFLDTVSGVFAMLDMITNQIDDEVTYYNSKMENIRLEYTIDPSEKVGEGNGSDS